MSGSVFVFSCTPLWSLSGHTKCNRNVHTKSANSDWPCVIFHTGFHSRLNYTFIVSSNSHHELWYKLQAWISVCISGTLHACVMVVRMSCSHFRNYLHLNVKYGSYTDLTLKTFSAIVIMMI